MPRRGAPGSQRGFLRTAPDEDELSSGHTRLDLAPRLDEDVLAFLTRETPDADRQRGAAEPEAPTRALTVVLRKCREVDPVRNDPPGRLDARLYPGETLAFADADDGVGPTRRAALLRSAAFRSAPSTARNDHAWGWKIVARRPRSQPPARPALDECRWTRSEPRLGRSARAGQSRRPSPAPGPSSGPALVPHAGRDGVPEQRPTRRRRHLHAPALAELIGDEVADRAGDAAVDRLRDVQDR